MNQNDITYAISNALYEHFGTGYKIYLKELKQGFEAPCFFILPIVTRQSREPSDRYNMRFKFDVMCLLKEGEMPGFVVDKLLVALEFITPEGGVLMGTDMSVELDGDSVHFFVTYELLATKELVKDEHKIPIGTDVDGEPMEKLDIEMTFEDKED